jgi:hypothetical protein
MGSVVARYTHEQGGLDSMAYTICKHYRQLHTKL